MPKDSGVRRDLKSREAEILSRLRKLSPDDVEALLDVQAALTGLETRPVDSQEYATYRKPHQAVRAYLEKVGMPTHREVIAASLVEGGYGKGDKRPYYDILDNISYYTDPKIQRKKPPILLEREDIISLPEWDETITVE